MEDGNFRPPTESTFGTPYNRSPKNLSQMITSVTPTAVPNLGHSHPWGFWANGWIITEFYLFIYLFIPFFRQLAYRSDASTDFRARWLKRRGLAQVRMWLFGIRWHYSPFTGKMPETPILGAWIGVFKPNSWNQKNMHIIKTTASIPTKFCTVIKTTKCPSWVVGTHI